MQIVGLKTERIRSNSSETMSVTIFFPDTESERIVCGYEYGIGSCRLRILIEYGTNTVWLRINISSDVALKIGLVYSRYYELTYSKLTLCIVIY